MRRLHLAIDGMRCDDCAERIQRLLSKEPGVREVHVSFATSSAEVRYNPHTVEATRRRLALLITRHDCAYDKSTSKPCE